MIHLHLRNIFRTFGGGFLKIWLGFKCVGANGPGLFIMGMGMYSSIGRNERGERRYRFTIKNLGNDGRGRAK